MEFARWPAKSVLAAFGLAILVSGSVFAFANYKATTAVRPAEVVTACRYSAGNWFLCTAAARAAIESGDTETGRELMLAELSRRPFDYMALRNLGIAAWNDGDKVTACNYFRREQILLNAENTNREFTDAHCEDKRLANALPEGALQRYREHLAWTKQVIENGGPKSTAESRDQK